MTYFLKKYIYNLNWEFILNITFFFIFIFIFTIIHGDFSSLKILIILFFSPLFILLLAFLLFQYFEDIKNWNKGICTHTGLPWVKNNDNNRVVKAFISTNEQHTTKIWFVSSLNVSYNHNKTLKLINKIKHKKMIKKIQNL
jgi:hypothetical protein